MPGKEERSQQQRVLLDEVEAAEQELKRLPGIDGVGVGFKERKGKVTDELSFRVYVTEKKPREQLSDEQLIPEELHGFRTDVIQTPVLTKYSDNSHYRPLKGGICVGPKDEGTGTIGWFGQLDADDRWVVLSNHHVLGDADTVVGQPQHTKFSGCCCDCNVIGSVLAGADNDKVDCAIAALNEDAADQILLEISNKLTENVFRIRGVAEAVCGDNVYKIGKRSGYTRGRVVEVRGTCKVVTEDLSNIYADKVEQVFIYPTDEETYTVQDDVVAFAYKGDSGSVIINEDHEIVALLEGGHIIQLDADDRRIRVTSSNKIQNVLAYFADQGFPLTLATSPLQRSGGSAGTKRTIAERSPEAAGRYVRAQLQQSPLGLQLLQLFERHADEVIRLVNHCRPVTVGWHRHQGPGFLQHVLRSAQYARHPIPAELEGVTLPALLSRMAFLLKKHGKAELRRDLNEQWLLLFSLIDECRTVQDFLHRVESSTYA